MTSPFEVRDSQGKVLFAANIRDTVAVQALILSKKDRKQFFECWDTRGEPNVFAEGYGGKVRWGQNQFLTEREADLPEPSTSPEDPFFTESHKRRVTP